MGSNRPGKVSTATGRQTGPKLDILVKLISGTIAAIPIKRINLKKEITLEMFLSMRSAIMLPTSLIIMQ